HGREVHDLPMPLEGTLDAPQALTGGAAQRRVGATDLHRLGKLDLERDLGADGVGTGDRATGGQLTGQHQLDAVRTEPAVVDELGHVKGQDQVVTVISVDVRHRRQDGAVG